jgi:hypothetical protein
MKTALRTSLLITVSFCAWLTLGAADAPWTVLFDGSSTAAWRGYKKADFPADAWVIEDDALKTVPGHEIDLITRHKYESFELELEWKVAKSSNSGIMFHVSEDFPQTYFTGPEMQIVDDDNSDDGKDPKTSAGSLYALIAPQGKTYHPFGQWNKVRILVKGPHVEYWMNGAKIVEYELGSDQLNALITHSKFNEMPAFAKEKSGFIALQNHGGEVWFRNIRIREL